MMIYFVLFACFIQQTSAVVLGSCVMGLTVHSIDNNTCQFPKTWDQTGSNAKGFVGGVVPFTQTRSIRGGISLRLKIDLQFARVLRFDIKTCGNPEHDSSDLPVLFHSSFSKIATGLGPDGHVLGGLGHELQVLAEDASTSAKVFANACTAPSKTASFDGDVSFKHAMLANDTDCLTITVRLSPQRIVMFHHRDPVGSLAVHQFDTLFDITSGSSCCTDPNQSAEDECPKDSPIDFPYWIGINQIIEASPGGSQKINSRYTSRGKEVAITFATDPNDCKPCWSGANCNNFDPNCVPPSSFDGVQTPSPGQMQAPATPSSEDQQEKGDTADEPDNTWIIALVIALVLLLLACCIIFLLFMRRGDAQDSERYDEQQTYGGVHETTEMPEHRAEASSSAFDLPSPPLDDDDDDNQELLGPGYPSSAVDAETVEFGREGGAAAQGDETMELQRPGSKETIDV